MMTLIVKLAKYRRRKGLYLYGMAISIGYTESLHSFIAFGVLNNSWLPALDKSYPFAVQRNQFEITIMRRTVIQPHNISLCALV